MKSSYTFGVVGHRISYSRSPELLEAVASIKGFRHDFVLHDISVDEFESKFPDVLKSGINGFSVTIPHKSRVIDFLSHVDPTARMIGAVNSVCVKGEQSLGYNTDAYGFSLPLEKHRSLLAGSTVLVIGAGGAARAVAHSLIDNFTVGRLLVLGRDSVKLEAFRSSLNSSDAPTQTSAVTYDNHEKMRGEKFSLIVNCTPLGGWNHLSEDPLPEDFNWRSADIYYDVNYNDENRLVSKALELGLTTYDGSIMLVGQALRSFLLWTGETVDLERVYDAVFGKR